MRGGIRLVGRRHLDLALIPVTTVTHDHADRVGSYRLLADAR
ncbi:hypothetical protein [Pseudonocardia endophytica]|nr:hypothetical protein [Pseudonocardia endophytica]